jgi:hypothetical protein
MKDQIAAVEGQIRQQLQHGFDVKVEEFPKVQATVQQKPMDEVIAEIKTQLEALSNYEKSREPNTLAAMETLMVLTASSISASQGNSMGSQASASKRPREEADESEESRKRVYREDPRF